MVLQLEAASTKILFSCVMALMFLVWSLENIFFDMGVVQIQSCSLRKPCCPGKPLVILFPSYFPLCKWVALGCGKVFPSSFSLLHPFLQGLLRSRMFSCAVCSHYSSLFDTIAGKHWWKTYYLVKYCLNFKKNIVFLGKMFWWCKCSIINTVCSGDMVKPLV